MNPTNPMRIAALAAAILFFSGCAQDWADASGQRRDDAALVKAQNQCKRVVFGTTGDEQISDIMASTSGLKGRQNGDWRAQYEACLKEKGWTYGDV